MPTHYEVLQVNSRATVEVIDAAYKALMKIHGVRRAGDSEEMAKKLNQARDALMDPKTRKSYDKQLIELHSGDDVIGEYRLLEFIAEGAIGYTFKAEHMYLKELVCIKQCNKISLEAEELFMSEVKSVWDLRHYALPVMRNWLRLPDGNIAIAMSYIPGPTIEQVVEKSGRLHPENVAWIAERLLNALSYMHANRVIHGDIKPQNIILETPIDQKHMAVLVDFGLAMKDPTKTSRNKGHTEVFGSPEAQDKINCPPLLPESHLYSLGMTMLYALSGDMERTRRRQIPGPSVVPKPLADFVIRLIDKDIFQRPNWQEDLQMTLGRVREESFGQRRSGFRPIPGF